MRHLVVCLVLALPMAATAEPVRYVTDTLTIPLRTGVTLQHKIVKMLSSGTPVEVLETNTENSRVRAGNTEGWVLTRFLDNVPSARNRVDQAEQKAATLELENIRLKGEIKTLSDQRGQMENTQQHLKEDSQRLKAELDSIRQTAASAIDIDNQNRQLKVRLIELERTLQTVRQENQMLKDRTARDWFMTGASVALLAVLVSLIVPKIVRWRRRSSWDTL